MRMHFLVFEYSSRCAEKSSVGNSLLEIKPYGGTGHKFCRLHRG